jgi:hypothetical protein
MGKGSKALEVYGQRHEQYCGRDAYIDGIDPLPSFTGRELPPFTPHLGGLAGAVGNSGGHEEADK